MKWIILLFTAFVLIGAADAQQVFNCCPYHTADCKVEAGCNHGCADISINPVVCCPSDLAFCDGINEEAPNPLNLTAEDNVSCALCDESFTNIGSCIKCSNAKLTSRLNGIYTAIVDIPTNFIRGIHQIIDGIYEGIAKNSAVGAIRQIIEAIVAVAIGLILLIPLILIMLFFVFMFLELWFIILSFSNDSSLGGFVKFFQYNKNVFSYVLAVVVGVFGGIINKL